METKNAHLGVDLIIGDDGELVLSPSGDLAVTQDGRDALAQDIRHVLESLPGDLFSHPEFGAGLGRLLGGEQRNHEERISRAVLDALLYHSSIASRVKTNTIKLRVELLADHQVLISIEIQPADESFLSLLNLVFRVGADGSVSLA